MKSLPKKISVAVSLLSVSLVVSFSSVGLNKSTGFLSEAKQFVKRADDTSAITDVTMGTPSSNKVTVKEALVADTYGSTTWTFYVPINTTFKTE